jgi:hypothetical protein
MLLLTEFIRNVQNNEHIFSIEPFIIDLEHECVQFWIR